MAAGQRVREEPLRLGQVVGAGHEGAADPHRLGDETGQFGVAVGEGQVEEVPAVHGECVEEHRGDGDLLGRRRHVHPRADAGGRLLEGAWPPVLVERDHLSVEDEPLGPQLQGDGGEFGEAAGDVVQGAGVDAYVGAVAVDLDADAVQLLLDRTRTQLRHGLRDGGRAVRQHRQDGAADGEPEFLQGRRPVREQRLGHCLQRSGEHHRPSYVGRGRPGGSGQALHGHRVQGALPDLAGEESEQVALLVLGGRRQQLAHQALAFGLRTGAGDAADRCEPGVHLAHGEAGLGRRRDLLVQHLPADAQPALGQTAREVGDDDRYVRRVGVPEQVGEQSRLPGAGRGGGHLLGHTGEPGEQHAAMVLRSQAGCPSGWGCGRFGGCGFVVACRAHAAVAADSAQPRAPRWPFGPIAHAVSRSVISSSPLIVAPARYPEDAALTTCSEKPIALPTAQTPGTVVRPVGSTTG